MTNNKAQLQQELLAKIKPGTKPSDLKKKSKKPNQISNSPPSIEINRDDGYSSDEAKNIPKASPLPNSQIKDLQSQITSLKKQLQLYKDFRESDLKIKEGYKKEIADLNLSRNKSEQKIIDLQQKVNDLLSKNQKAEQTIEAMKNQAKTKGNIKPEPTETTETKTFTCSECNQVKPQSELSRVFNNFSFCLECSKKARQTATQQKQKPNPVDFICHLCEQTKQEIPTKIKLDKTLTDYSVCSSCKPTAKEFNEADLITDDLWTKYPYSSASEILELEFGIKRN